MGLGFAGGGGKSKLKAPLYINKGAIAWGQVVPTGTETNDALTQIFTTVTLPSFYGGYLTMSSPQAGNYEIGTAINATLNLVPVVGDNVSGDFTAPKILDRDNSVLANANTATKAFNIIRGAYTFGCDAARASVLSTLTKTDNTGNGAYTMQNVIDAGHPEYINYYANQNLSSLKDVALAFGVNFNGYQKIFSGANTNPSVNASTIRTALDDRGLYGLNIGNTFTIDCGTGANNFYLIIDPSATLTAATVSVTGENVLGSFVLDSGITTMKDAGGVNDINIKFYKFTINSAGLYNGHYFNITLG